MSYVSTHTKDPDARLDYTLDWSDFLAPASDQLSTVTYTADPGITITSQSLDVGTSTTTVWLSGGSVGSQYKVTAHITTVGGRQDDRTQLITVAER